MTDSWLQLGLASVGVITAAIALFRYVITNIKTMQANFLDSQKTQQSKLFEYMETKNGHMERIANRFADSSDEVAKKIGELTIHIDKLSRKRK